MYPSVIKKIIDNFKDFPGIGDKSAERLTFSLINFDKDKLQSFADAIIEVKEKIGRCRICGSICEGELCSICQNESRNRKNIFVVEKPKDVFLFEKLGIYDGVYHVLGGLISPLDGINPEDIAIDSLVDRINKNEAKEIILALKPTIEGETTMQYIKKILEPYEIKVTKIATGIPIGTDMEYIDTMTLEMALEQRKDFT